MKQKNAKIKNNNLEILHNSRKIKTVLWSTLQYRIVKNNLTCSWCVWKGSYNRLKRDTLYFLYFKVQYLLKLHIFFESTLISSFNITLMNIIIY